MPIRLCAHPTCPQPATYRGRCPTHARHAERATHSAAHRRIYTTKRWRITRRAYLFDHPICQRCDSALATDVHHIIDLAKDGDPYHPSNLEALCHPCHSRHTRTTQGAAA